MYNIKLSGLDTGRVYYVKVRAKVNGYETSEWTIPYKFETPKDTMPPGRIEELSWISDGDSFIAQWKAPQFNEDGSPCGDISHYNLVFEDLDRNITRTRRSVDTSFALDFNQNNLMFGQPAGRIRLTITAVDLSNNEGKTVTATAENPPPAKVQNVSALAKIETVVLTWNANTENDLAKYEVHVGSTSGFTPNASTIRANVAPGSTSFSYDSTSLSDLYFKILAVDKFNQKSTPSDVVSARPRLTTDLDLDPPAGVTGFTAVQSLASDNNTAVARISFAANSESDLDKYEVQYRKTGDTTAPWSFANVPSDQNSAEIKPLPLSTSYDFRIRAVDFSANKGVWSSVVVAAGVKKTTLPAAPTGLVVKGGLTNLMITWNASTDVSMANWAGTYEVQVSKATNFSSPVTIKTASTLASFMSMDANTVYYARVRAIDPFSNIGAWSSTANGNTGQVADPNASKITWADTAPTGSKTNDLWIKTPENVQYRYNGTIWQKAQDSELSSGIAGAQQTADGKNTIYFATPPASGIKEGDTWFDGPAIKQYKSGQWVNVSNSLETTQAGQALQVAGSKNKTYYVARGSATGMIEGDTLFDPTEGNKIYRYNGTTWVSTQDASIASAAAAAGQAQQTADGKNTIYYSTPPSTGLKNGDVWFDGAVIKTYRNNAWVDSSTALTTQQGSTALQIAGEKNKTYYASYANRPTTGLTTGDLLFDTADKYKQYRWNGSAWESVRDGTILDAQTAANDAKTAAELRAQTFYEATEPANTNSRLKVNDLWIKSSNNQLHRWTGSAWVEIQDDAIALTQANLTTAVGDLQTSIGNVQAIADGKINSFISNVEPTEGLDEGDIWFDTSVSPISVKVYDGTDWEVSGDKAALDAAAAVQINLNATNTAVNKKNTTYAQTSAPATGLVVGDLWLNTTLVSGVPKNELNRWNGSIWVKTQDKTIFDVQALADGKAKVFTKATMPTDVESELGDIWFDSSNTPWLAKVRTGAGVWTESGDKNARDAATAAQTEASRKIQSFYGDTDPATITANNVKAGDLWYKIADKRARVRAANNTWIELKDADITAAQTTANTAITNASNAFNLADGKAQIFRGGTRPTTLGANDAGDMWVDVSKTPNEIQVWSGTTWTVAGDPATKTIADAATTLAGQKAYVYTQTTTPTSNPTPTRGDTWIHTITGETKIYSGTAWIAMTDPAAADIAKSKITTYYNGTTPTAPTGGFTTGDLWVKTPDNRLNRWSGTAWIELKDKAISDAETAINTANANIGTLTTNLGNLSTQVDKKIEVTIGGTRPSFASATAAQREAAKGDMHINTTNGLVTVYSGTADVWNEVKDPAALSAANSAATLAGTKKQIFGGNTAPSNNTANALQTNDLWIRDSDKKMHRWTGSAWEIAQDYKIDASALKGNNLVFNGHGELGDNTNWPGTVYSASDAPPGSKGSFVVTGKKTITLTENIAVNPYSNYTMSVWAKRLGTAVDRAYLFLAPFDAYNLSIQPWSYMYRPGSTTQLTEDLKPGDTEIKVGSTAAWNSNNTNTNYGIIFWDYTDPGGKLWPKETYSRNYYNAANSYDATVPLPPTSIPLRVPWTGPLKPAGTWLSSGLSGGSYMYNAMSATTLQPEWTFYKSAIIGGVHDTPASSAITKFPIATAFVKIGFLANFDNAPGAEQAYSGLDFSDVNAAQDMATSAMESANARNRSIFSTGNATGTSRDGYSFVNGDMWYRKDANNTVIGMWEFLNGAWIAKTLNNQVIANLDAGKINAGIISADRIGANSIGAQKLVIGRAENIVNDPEFTSTTMGHNWTSSTNVSIVQEGSNGSNALKIVNAASQQAMYNNPQDSTYLEQGTVVRAVVTLRSDVAIPSASVGIGLRLRSPSGQITFPGVFRVLPQSVVSSFQTFDLGMITIPSSGKLSFYIVSESNLSTGTIWIDNISIMRASGQTMIADGAIVTEKIAADSITAGKIATGAVTADKILANQIDATKIVSTGLDGSVVITNGTITGTKLVGQTITGDKIAANTIKAGNIEAGSITIGPSSPIAPGTVATPSDVSGALSTANSNIATAKAEAIAAAATDAETKANAAKVAAEAAAKAYADGEISESALATIQAAAADAEAKANAARQEAITAAATDATSKANAAKAAALLEAATDAQTKADAAKLAAEQAANDYADGKISDSEVATLAAAATDAQTKANAAKTAAEEAANAYTNTAVAPINTTLTKWTKTGTTFIDGGEIFTDSITAGQIAANAITASELAANAVTAAKIKSDEIETRHIKTGQITTDKVVVGGLDGTTAIANGTITTDKINARAITAEKLAVGSIVIGGANSPVNASSMETAILQSRTKDYGFAYKTSITLYGDHNKYYPVAMMDGDQSVDRQIMIRRNYSELHPPEWNSPTHGGGLYLLSTVNFGGWGGITYKQRIDQLQQQYNDTLADIRLVPTGGGTYYFLRGGGTTGAVYHVYSDQPLAGPSVRLYDSDAVTKLDKPHIFYEPQDFYIGTGGTYKYVSPAPMTAPDTTRIKEMTYVEASKTAHQLTDGWRFTGTTEINGGAIRADTITAAKIKAGAITIGPNAPIAPGTVAVPSDVTNAISTASSDATTKANAAKSEAIAAAASDATTKANNAAAAAQQAAIDHANGEITDAELRAATDAATKANAARDAAITAAQNDATTKANQARIDAIATAATDAQNKANAAKAAAEAAAKAYADGEISEATAQALIDAAADAQTKANAAKTAAENAANAYTNTTVAPINTTLGNWRYADTTFINGGSIYTNTITANQIAANTITADEIAANAITASELAADSVVAAKIKAGEITGAKLAVDTAVVNGLKIQSSIEINAAGGHIKSSNWNDAAKTGFYMDQQQLIIHNGRIEASAIKLQDSANIMPPAYASFSQRAYQGALTTSGVTSATTKPGEGRFGGSALELVFNANGFAMMAPSGVLNVPIEGGKQYILSFYISNRANKAITITPSLYSTASILVNGAAQTIANTTAWTRYSVVVTAPANMNRAAFRVNLTAGTPATFRLDGLQVEQKIGAETAPSSWSPPGLTEINGELITTGAIQSSNVDNFVGNGNLPAWSIDTQGNATFSDAVIKGRLIVGGYGPSANTENEKVSIQSDNYSTGFAGWRIKGNGDAEFNNGTFRGKLNLERAGNQEIDLKMSASVSNIKLFINENDHKDIDVASIRGVTYAYDRAQINGEGPYYPSSPVPSKIGRYYIGPTTDRSVNIQVHEGEEDAVYLETPPNDVALTSLFVGELTNPANEPVERERQGFGFSATRIETDPSTPSRKSSTGVSQSSSVQLRSPFYPESIEGEYPESTHLFESKVDFKSPLSKNLFFRSYALPDLTVGGGTTSRVNRPDYVSRAYELVNPVNKSTYVKIPVSGAGNPAATKRHIFSVHVDTLDAFTDTAVYAFANNTPMNPIGDEKLTAGQTAYQHADTLSTLAPNYHYQFNTAAATYSNSGSGGEVLTRTHGSAITGPESTIFNSGNTRYTAPSTYDMSLGMSFSVWFQPTYVSGENVFFHRGTANMREIWIRYNATNRTFTGGMVSASMTTWSAPNNLIDPAKWNQVTFTFDSIGAGTKNMRIYVNGSLEHTQVITGWTTLFSNEPIYLFSNLQASTFYLGGLSEPMVFHKVLTAAQVTSLYNRGTAIYRAGGFSTLSQNGILVETGQSAKRIAFEYTPSTSVATTITLQVVGASSNQVLAYKLQLERASYQENMSLPERIRSKIAPTPWMTNGSTSLSTATLKLRAEPSPDVESWLISSLGDYQKMGPPGLEANKKRAPAELELSLVSSYSHPGGGDATIANATYKWGTTGMSYPGVKFPFMPAAASIIWDYTSLALASRPQIGGSGNLITTINLANSSFGAINTGAGKSLEDTFTASDGTQLGYPWIRVGIPDLPIYANTVRIRKFAHTEFGIPGDFVYNAEPLIQTNQEVHIRVDSTVVTFGSTYRYNGALVINYDPNTDSGIFARVRDGGTRLWEVYVMNNGLITYSTSGTFSTAVNNWTDFKLRRENSNVRLTLGSVILFNGTIGTLPTGKYVGFSMDGGRMDNFKAYDIAPGSTAMGMLMPESINVNQGRGLLVNANGIISVDVPGYYMVTGTVRGAIGGDIARTYWLEIFENRNGVTKSHPISGMQNRSSSDMDYVSGSGICYLEGNIEFRIITHTTNVSRISGADLHIVRMA